MTGAGTARDCSLRGLKVLLVERNDIATGASGRNHGLLHSGARYAVTDTGSAAECIAENLILKKIASKYVEDTAGFFVSLPEDDLSYQDTFIASCLKAGIKAEAFDPKEALAMEPSINPSITGAVKVPDASVNSFKLCAANIMDAKLHGASVLVYTEVKEILRNGTTVTGIRVFDKTTRQEKDYHARIVINAAGIWGHHIANMAGVNVAMHPSKGTLLIYAHRMNNMVVNRCRKPGDADILVPAGTVSVLGTTSVRVPFSECDYPSITAEEIDLLVDEGSKLVPSLGYTRILRAYSGVRPLLSAGNDPSGRNISRGFSCIDHEQTDGLEGFVTICGGKLTTYRLMSEVVTDLVCRKLGVTAKCVTAQLPLPDLIEPQRIKGGNMVCECEGVSEAEIDNAVHNLDVNSLVDLRRRTRFGMGVCQGELCSCRAAGLIANARGCAEQSMRDARDFIRERWRGMYHVAWGDTLRENELTQWVQSEVLGLDALEQ